MTGGEKVYSLVCASFTWFLGIFLFDSPVVGFFIKGLMWLGGLAISAFIPKIVSTYYDNRLKDRLDKYFKKSKNAESEKDNSKAA
ncbi:MAG: hypothetical protein H7X88_01660 [Gloeobacteraceae cyanobacterium ES-bin-316]|nr:hypothetical protein [Ferruginibacter sp.]